MTTTLGESDTNITNFLSKLCLHEPSIKLDEAKLSEVASNIATLIKSKNNKRLLQGPFSAVPLQFDDVAEEANFWALLQLVAGPCEDIPRPAVEDSTYRSPEETAQLGVFSMFVTQKAGTDQLLDIDLSTIASFFDMKIEQDVEVMPAVYQSEASPLKSVAVRIQEALKKAAAKMFARQARSVGHWIESMISNRYKNVTANDPDAKVSASYVVEQIVNTIDTFNAPEDYHRRAQVLVLILNSIFAETQPAFRFSDLSQLRFSVTDTIGEHLCNLGVVDKADDKQTVAHVVDRICKSVEVLVNNEDIPKGTSVGYIVDQFLRSET